jgi:hypothetical protein
MKIYKHPDVEDYFHMVDVNNLGHQNIYELYEGGKVIGVQNKKIDFDVDFFNQLKFNGDNFKKIKSINFLNQIKSEKLGEEYKNIKKSILEDVFFGDLGKFTYFLRQMNNINEQVDGLIKDFFPKYMILKPSITWRLNETWNENLHFDVYREDIETHHLRVFVNLDSAPRIWHTSHSLESLLKNELTRLDRSFISQNTPGRICHTLNFEVFKGFEESGREGQPKHIIFFEPGDIWFVDSRKVSHQIFFGRKALSTEYVIHNDSMRDPKKHYLKIVDDAVNRMLEL